MTSTFEKDLGLQGEGEAVAGRHAERVAADGQQRDEVVDPAFEGDGGRPVSRIEQPDPGVGRDQPADAAELRQHQGEVRERVIEPWSAERAEDHDGARLTFQGGPHAQLRVRLVLVEWHPLDRDPQGSEFGDPRRASRRRRPSGRSGGRLSVRGGRHRRPRRRRASTRTNPATPNRSRHATRPHRRRGRRPARSRRFRLTHGAIVHRPGGIRSMLAVGLSAPMLDSSPCLTRSTIPAVRRVLAAAERKRIDLAVVTFDESTHTAAQAATAVGGELGQIVKSLVFVTPSDDGPEPVCPTWQNRVDLVCLAAVTGEPDIRRATAREANDSEVHDRRHPADRLRANGPRDQRIRTLVDTPPSAAAGLPTAVFEVPPATLRRSRTPRSHRSARTIARRMWRPTQRLLTSAAEAVPATPTGGTDQDTEDGAASGRLASTGA